MRSGRSTGCGTLIEKLARATFSQQENYPDSGWAFSRGRRRYAKSPSREKGIQISTGG